MPTIIDSLIISLSLDPKNFDEGSKKATEALLRLRIKAEEENKRTAAAVDKSAKAVHGLAREFIGLAAIVVGANGVADYVAKTVTQFTRLEIAAKQAGVSVSYFKSYSNLIAANGGDANTAAQTLANMSAQLYQWKALGQVSQQMLGAAQLVGFGPNDNVEQVNAKFANYAHRVNPQQAHMVGQMLGYSEAEIDQLMQGAGALKAGLAKNAPKSLNEKDAMALKNLNKSWQEFSQTIGGDLAHALASAAPYLEGLLKFIEGAAAKSPAAVVGIIGIAAALGTLVGALNALSFVGIKFGTKKAAEIVAEEVTEEAVKDGGVVAAEAAATAGGGTAGGILGLIGRGVLGALRIGGPIAAGLSFMASPGNEGHNDENARMRGINQGADLKYLEQRLKAAGYSDAAVSGILRGVKAEGGAVDANGPLTKWGHRAHGLGQWLDPKRLQNFENLFGHDIGASTLKEQADFMLWELSNSEAGADAAIRGASSSDAATLAYITKYMRPGTGTEGDLARAGLRSSSGGANVNIGNVTINTPSTDPAAHASAFSDEVRRQTLAAQSNSGLAQ